MQEAAVGAPTGMHAQMQMGMGMDQDLQAQALHAFGKSGWSVYPGLDTSALRRALD